MRQILQFKENFEQKIAQCVRKTYLSATTQERNMRPIDLANAVGCNVSTVYDRMRQFGITTIRVNKRSVLAAADAEKIRGDLTGQGMPRPGRRGTWAAGS